LRCSQEWLDALMPVRELVDVLPEQVAELAQHGLVGRTGAFENGFTGSAEVPGQRRKDRPQRPAEVSAKNAGKNQ
jgi:hypothetical protein